MEISKIEVLQAAQAMLNLLEQLHVKLAPNPAESAKP